MFSTIGPGGLLALSASLFACGDAVPAADRSPSSEALGGVAQEAPSSELGKGELALEINTAVSAPTSPGQGTLFESLQVRPLALSPRGDRLFAVNTPDHRLEVLQVGSGGLRPLASVSVGLEPVAVAARNDEEVWVVNHLSDSVSVVRWTSAGSPYVAATLLVGDEPRDIVFAGPNRSRAFITTAHRGQNSPDDPDLFAPGAGRADVWVFDADNLGAELGGTRLTKLTFFADTPRALAASADGSRVYAAAFFSGNETTVVSADAVRHVYANSLDPENPSRFLVDGVSHVLTGRIVKFKPDAAGDRHWLDDLGTNFDAWVRISLPDNDVFAIDALASPPAAVRGGSYAHVGTTLFNMAVNPRSGKVYVANTEAHNDVRFEGDNPSLPVTSVRGAAVGSRISVLDPGTGALVHSDLNSHLRGGIGDAHLSRAFPQDLSVTADGRTLGVVLQGSAKLALYETAAIEAGRATPTASNQVRLSAGGPTGLVFDERRGRAYVLTRFDNGISTVSLPQRREVAHLRMFNPEPPLVTQGRRFLYDATLSSENGTQACASCHVGGDFDGLAWDLGNPGAEPLPITRDVAADDVLWTAPPAAIAALLPESAPLFRAHDTLKGPLTTQSLRGLDNHGSMHWRGDRNGAIAQDGAPFVDPATGQDVMTAQPNSGQFDELAAFTSFNVAFPGLLGRREPLPPAAMEAFARFALEITYPPNPIRALDNSLTPTQQAGRDFYFQTNASGQELPVDRLHNCNGCHTLDPHANEGSSRHPGFFGTSGRLSFENLPQVFKVAHLRNAYQKVGMFASSPDDNRSFTPSPELNPPLAAVRGFGYQPDGAVGAIEHHITGRVFIRTLLPVPRIGANPGGIPTFLFDAAGNPVGVDPAGFALRRAIASFVLAYDSNLKPIVGQQVTLTAASGAPSHARADLLEARARLGECELVAKALVRGREQGFLLLGDRFVSDRPRARALSSASLRALVGRSTDALTLTCVPPGSGASVAFDQTR